MELSGEAAGIPVDARIDAISEAPSGALELSFDVPVRLGTTDYGRSDLVLWEAGIGFSLVWSGGTEGVPAYANLVGASRDASGERVLAFDVPVLLGGIDYLPGDLLRVAPFSLASRDSGWPLSSELRDFTSIPSVGRVPEHQADGVPLTISKSVDQIELAWGAACGATASTDYAVYEGTIGSWYSHTARSCSTNGMLSTSFVPPAGNRYYLVAARNGASQGSYGTDSSGAEIPPAPDACVPQELASCP
jgi:hypothetical protein